MLTQAVILCGGLGTRLGSFTAKTPKPMLEVAGRPFLDILIAELSRFGIEKIVLLAGHFGDQIQNRYEGREIFHTKVNVLTEPEPMGTGGALRFALPQLEAEFLLMNGDSWIDANLTDFSFEWERARNAQVQLLLHHVSDVGRYGSVIEQNGIITAFEEKASTGTARSGWINAGIYALRRNVVEAIPASTNVSFERDVLPDLVANGKAIGVKAPEGCFFIDIGVPESFAHAQTAIDKARWRPAIFLDRDGTLNYDRGYTHKIEDLHWIEGAKEAVRIANAAGFYVFIVSNQAGVARGFYAEADVLAFYRAMQKDLFSIGDHFDGIIWCPHHPDGVVEAYSRECDCRKPAPGMLTNLLETWPIDIAHSVMIGDSDTDMIAGRAAGLRVQPYLGGNLSQIVMQYLTKI